MQATTNERLRAVIGSTQENLETALGSAVTGWGSVNLRFLRPMGDSVAQFFSCCWAPQRRQRPTSDIYFDMYDENEREELERLLEAEDGGNIYDSEDEEFGEFVASNPRPPTSRRTWWDSFRDYFHGGSTMLGRSGQQSILRYRPSTAGLTGLENRERSSTKSSLHSSDTYRSRREIFGDDTIENDAQMVSDNFAADMTLEERSSEASAAASSVRSMEERTSQGTSESKQALVDLPGERDRYFSAPPEIPIQHKPKLNGASSPGSKSIFEAGTSSYGPQP